MATMHFASRRNSVLNSGKNELLLFYFFAISSVFKMSSKSKKRLERLSSCVKANDVDRLESYLRRKKYARLDLDEAVVNKRGETLLHLACRLIKPHIVQLLITHSLGEPTSRDLKGNTPLHAALIAVMEIDDKHDYLSGLWLTRFDFFFFI